MQDRLNQFDVANRVDVEDADRVRDFVISMFAARYPNSDLSPLARAFADIKALFEGTYPGYLPCDTLYHDLRHTLDISLATARLIEGHDRVQQTPQQLGPRRAILGVIIALLHDSGYIRRESEAHVENGAVFTKVHVSRSAEFLLDYLPRLGPLWVTEKYYDNNKDTVRKFIRAVVKSEEYIADNKAGTVPVIQKGMASRVSDGPCHRTTKPAASSTNPSRTCQSRSIPQPISRSSSQKTDVANWWDEMGDLE